MKSERSETIFTALFTTPVGVILASSNYKYRKTLQDKINKKENDIKKIKKQITSQKKAIEELKKDKTNSIEDNYFIAKLSNLPNPHTIKNMELEGILNSLKKDLIIKLGKPYFELRPMLKGCANGLSELFTNISASIVSIIYNYQLMSLAGENGIASYGVILYAQFIFLAVYFGYSMGTAPIFGFNYGAKNTFELKNLFKKSIKLLFWK